MVKRLLVCLFVFYLGGYILLYSFWLVSLPHLVTVAEGDLPACLPAYLPVSLPHLVTVAEGDPHVHRLLPLYNRHGLGDKQNDLRVFFYFSKHVWIGLPECP